MKKICENVKRLSEERMGLLKLGVDGLKKTNGTNCH